MHGSGQMQLPKQRTLMYPRSIDVQDLLGVVHRLEVKVLGTEETWNTPSLMVATNPKTSGVAVFSQVSDDYINFNTTISIVKCWAFRFSGAFRSRSEFI